MLKKIQDSSGGDRDSARGSSRKKRDGVKGPGAEALTATLNTLSSRVHEAAQRGSTNTECSDLLANLDITLGEPANEAAIRAAQVWASVEDENDVVEAMRADAAENITRFWMGWPSPGGKLARKRRRTAVMMRARSAGWGHHRPTLNSRPTLASSRRQRRTVATKTPRSTCSGRK